MIAYQPMCDARPTILDDVDSKIGVYCVVPNVRVNDYLISAVYTSITVGAITETLVAESVGKIVIVIEVSTIRRRRGDER